MESEVQISIARRKASQPGRRTTAQLHTHDKARRLAANIADRRRL
jgi:hypothetical protein